MSSVRHSQVHPYICIFHFIFAKCVSVSCCVLLAMLPSNCQTQNPTPFRIQSITQARKGARSRYIPRNGVLRRKRRKKGRGRQLPTETSCRYRRLKTYTQVSCMVTLCMFLPSHEPSSVLESRVASVPKHFRDLSRSLRTRQCR